MNEVAPRPDIPLPAEITHPAQAEMGIRYHKAILDVMRRGRVELRKQVKVLRKIVEYAVEGADLTDDMHEGKIGDNQWSSELRMTYRKLGVDPRRVDEWRSLRDHDALAFIDAALADELEAVFTKASINWLRVELERQARQSANDELGRRPVIIPDGIYSSIVIDPPWDMEMVEREVRPNQIGLDYPTMTEEQLIAYRTTLEPHVAEDCHMFMWTTQRFLPVSLRVLDAWAFRYVLTMVWHKAGGPQPFGLPQYNCEFVVYARRGAPFFLDTTKFNCCFQAPRREHSRKPDEFYDVVRRVTDGPRADWFSREQRTGFESIGNEPTRFGEAVA